MTGLMDLFKEALEYPTKDFKALLIFGVIFLISSLSSVLTSWGIEIPGSALLVVQIVYYIIPAIITLIIGWITGTFSAVFNIVNYVGQDLTNTTINATTAANSVPAEYWSALFTGLLITAIIGMILFIIFGLLLNIAMCRLAKYDDIGEALNFKEVIGDIQEIGIARYIGWYILLGLVASIPYIGILISFLVCTPFIALFGSRALGALYSDAE